MIVLDQILVVPACFVAQVTILVVQGVPSAMQLYPTALHVLLVHPAQLVKVDMLSINKPIHVILAPLLLILMFLMTIVMTVHMENIWITPVFASPATTPCQAVPTAPIKAPVSNVNSDSSSTAQPALSALWPCPAVEPA